MEKEMCNNPEHSKLCGWCGQNKTFSGKRLVLAILLGLFIFCLGIQIGEMRGQYGQYQNRGMMMHQRWGRQGMMQNDMPGQDGLGVPQNGTTTIVVPAQPTAPVTAPAAR